VSTDDAEIGQAFEAYVDHLTELAGGWAA